MATINDFRVQVLDLQLNADGSAALITRQGKGNPSANGVFKLKAAQVQRLSQRCLGIVNLVGLKSLIALSFGSAFYKGKVQTVKAGDTYEVTNPDGTKTEKVYEGSRNPANLGGAWEKTSTEELELGAVATAKVAELSLGASFQHAAMMYAQIPAPQMRQAVNADPGTKQEEGGEDAPDTGSESGEETQP